MGGDISKYVVKGIGPKNTRAVYLRNKKVLETYLQCYETAKGNGRTKVANAVKETARQVEELGIGRERVGQLTKLWRDAHPEAPAPLDESYRRIRRGEYEELLNRIRALESNIGIRFQSLEERISSHVDNGVASHYIDIFKEESNA